MKSNKLKEKIASFGMNVIIKRRYLFLLLLLVLVVICAVGAQKVRLNSNDEAFFPEDSPTLKKYDRFKEIFGSEEYIFILVESEQIFNYDVLKYIDDLSQDINENLPFVKKVTSLTNIEYLQATDNNLIIEDLFKGGIPKDPEKLNQVKDKVLAKKSYVGSIITADAKSTGIIVQIKALPDSVYASVPENFTPIQQENWPPEEILMKSDLYTNPAAQEGLNQVLDPRKLITPALRVILNRQPEENVKVYATGTPIINYEPDLVAAQEGGKFGVIALLAAVILMFLLFRSFRAILGPFIVILFTMIMLFGLLGWLNLELSMLIIIIPTLILVISVSYSIHVINHFLYAFNQTGSRAAAVKYAYQESTWPILITAVTTALGFLSFVVLPMPPIKVIGISCALGVFIAYLLVMTIIPIIFSIGKDRTNKKGEIIKQAKQESFRDKMVSWSNFVANNVKFTVLLTVILVLVLIGFSFKMQVDPDILEMIGDDVKFVRDTKYITERLGSPYSYEILIELPEEEMAKNSAILQEVDRMSDLISNWETTSNITSLTNIIKDLNLTMNNNNEGYYTVPDSEQLISQYLLLYEMSGGEGLEEWVNFSYDKMRLSVQVNEFKERLNNDFEKISAYAEQHFPAGTKVTVVGNIPISLQVMEYISQGQITSILLALLVITIIMIIVLKSLKLGLLSMLPNVIPILTIIGLMGMVGIPLNLFTLIIAPMILGIAVDDTVHYFVHFKEEFMEAKSYSKANRETFKKIGPALIFTSVILMIGYGIFSVSKMQAFAHVAILSTAGIFIALVADMFLTPAIIMYLKPFGRPVKVTEKENASYEN